MRIRRCETFEALKREQHVAGPAVRNKAVSLRQASHGVREEIRTEIAEAAARGATSRLPVTPPCPLR